MLDVLDVLDVLDALRCVALRNKKEKNTSRTSSDRNRMHFTSDRNGAEKFKLFKQDHPRIYVAPVIKQSS